MFTVTEEMFKKARQRVQAKTPGNEPSIKALAEEVRQIIAEKGEDKITPFQQEVLNECVGLDQNTFFIHRKEGSDEIVKTHNHEEDALT